MVQRMDELGLSRVTMLEHFRGHDVLGKVLGSNSGFNLMFVSLRREWNDPRGCWLLSQCCFRCQWLQPWLLPCLVSHAGLPRLTRPLEPIHPITR